DIDTVLDLGITTVDLSIRDMAFTDFQIYGTAVTTMPDTQQLQISLDGVALSLSFSWSFRETTFPFISDHGTGTAGVTNIKGDVIAGTDFDEECGILQMSMDECVFDLGDIVVHLDGGASALYNTVLAVLIDMFQDVFTDQLDTVIASGITASINDGIMDQKPYRYLQDNVLADFRMVSPGMVVDDNYVSLQFTGYGYPGTTTDDWPQRIDDGLRPGPMGGRVNDEDMQFEVSHTVYESIYDVGISMGLMGGEVDPTLVTDPKVGVEHFVNSKILIVSYLTFQIQSMLNTAVVAPMCPGLYAAYPDQPIYLSLMPSAEVAICRDTEWRHHLVPPSQIQADPHAAPIVDDIPAHAVSSDLASLDALLGYEDDAPEEEPQEEEGSEGSFEIFCD
ncbi:hypothetical protein KIPB_009787, partial [Kipferlia bialata]